MKLSQIVYKINKIMLNVIKFHMKSFFHNGATKLWRVIAPQDFIFTYNPVLISFSILLPTRISNRSDETSQI